MVIPDFTLDSILHGFEIMSSVWKKDSEELQSKLFIAARHCTNEAYMELVEKFIYVRTKADNLTLLIQRVREDGVDGLLTMKEVLSDAIIETDWSATGMRLESRKVQNAALKSIIEGIKTALADHDYCTRLVGP